MFVMPIGHIKMPACWQLRIKSAQSYEKKCTFANFREEKLQFTAFLVTKYRSGSHESDATTLKREAQLYFLRETMLKCPASP